MQKMDQERGSAASLDRPKYPKTEARKTQTQTQTQTKTNARRSTVPVQDATARIDFHFHLTAEPLAPSLFSTAWNKCSTAHSFQRRTLPSLLSACSQVPGFRQPRFARPKAPLSRLNIRLANQNVARLTASVCFWCNAIVLHQHVYTTSTAFTTFNLVASPRLPTFCFTSRPTLWFCRLAITARCRFPSPARSKSKVHASSAHHF